jgi:aldose 1-epimerase
VTTPADAARPEGAGDDAALRPILLRSAAGHEALVLPFGATLARLRAPDREGRLGDVLLSLAALSDYAGDQPHLGATVGRYANRIRSARFALDGRCHVLPANDGPHHLHGGPRGLSRRVWRELERFALPGGAGVLLGLESPDGDQGYPGALAITARFALDAAGALRIDYHATSDAPTVLSISNHAYFALDDGGASPVLDQRLWLRASRYTPVDDAGLPTGAIEPVADTPFDFREPRALGERIAALVPRRGGYDHNFALDAPGDLAAPAAHLAAPRSGRVLTVHTTQPGLQLYTGNHLGGLRCQGGVRPGRWCALCLETQSFPNAPNEPGFPPARVDPGIPYHHTTVYAVAIERGSGPAPCSRSAALPPGGVVE